ncbi:LLM class flavin-dependent oxidoreductase, partial [Mesorhizobium sp. M1E.F.Ca.ET.041.01.1.1]
MTLAHKPGSIVGIPYFKAPTDYPDSPLSKALEQPVLLGLFLP